MITFDDFAKLEIKIGTILEAEVVPEADRLLKLKVNLGTETVQIISGVREHYPDPSILIGKQVPVLVNLEPRMIKGFESKGMILYVVGEGENFTTLEPEHSVENGTQIR